MGVHQEVGIDADRAPVSLDGELRLERLEDPGADQRAVEPRVAGDLFRVREGPGAELREVRRRVVVRADLDRGARGNERHQGGEAPKRGGCPLPTIRTAH
jgi:hypothetical protein